MDEKTPTPLFPLDAYHAWYRAGPFFVDVRRSGALRMRVLVQLLSIREESPDGKTAQDLIALTIRVGFEPTPGLDAKETKEGGR